MAHNHRMPAQPGKNGIKALLFDVFGTLVDWRGSIAREVQAILAPRGVAIDWPAFGTVVIKRSVPPSLATWSCPRKLVLPVSVSVP